MPAASAARWRAALGTLVIVLGGAAPSGGCNRDEQSLLSQPIGPGVALEGGIGLPAAAVEAIAERRCVRMAQCGQIGLGRRYPQRVECLIDVRASWADELNGVACPRGVHEDELAACLRELELEPCADIHTAERASLCKASAICATRAPAPAVLPPIRPVPESGQ